ncbi:predicted protein [Verticillium alfalfae VaMs.102]|uniref:Predicted protein n=1 Tax=Verticillium alfalfae (strain VaMs.102 / ATCC MYA-4576 / FGSC 10136) TaxID=526221 RepID=C9SAJ8_VERA1|nr:predicted protein [Verticillium alfalfae VaMs.102]EEY15446.1 predicted protein [Verticillium alfalfae VaMs.102]
MASRPSRWCNPTFSAGSVRRKPHRQRDTPPRSPARTKVPFPAPTTQSKQPRSRESVHRYQSPLADLHAPNPNNPTKPTSLAALRRAGTTAGFSSLCALSELPTSAGRHTELMEFGK